MTTQPAPVPALPACPDCGGSTRYAFPGKSTVYVACRRCGHVHDLTQKESR